MSGLETHIDRLASHRQPRQAHDLLDELASIEAHRAKMRDLDGDPQPAQADATARIKAAILAHGKANGGVINPNLIRRTLREITPRHKRIGPAYSSLRAAGLIAKNPREQQVQSDDTEGGNAGRWIDTYRLTEKGWQA